MNTNRHDVIILANPMPKKTFNPNVEPFITLEEAVSFIEAQFNKLQNGNVKGAEFQ